MEKGFLMWRLLPKPTIKKKMRETEREGKRERGRERERERERERDRQRDRETERQRERERQRVRERQRESERETDGYIVSVLRRLSVRVCRLLWWTWKGSNDFPQPTWSAGCSVFLESRKVMSSKELPSGRRMSPQSLSYALEGAATAQVSVESGEWQRRCRELVSK